MQRNSDIAVRVRLFFFFVTVVLIGLCVRLYHVQISRHPELFAKAKHKYTSIRVQEGKRGEIFDRDGNLLVGNIPCFNICADPQIVKTEKEAERIAAYFATKLQLSKTKLMRRLTRWNISSKNSKGLWVERPNRYALIANKIELSIANDIKGDVDALGLKGIAFTESSKRYYPKNELLANVLGFTNINHDRVVAVIGIERFLDDRMSPTMAKVRYERSRDGLPLSYGEQEIQAAKNGLNVYLTIHEPIQAILEEELDKLMEKWAPRAAYAIMANPRTGDIMAIAQRPSFNPNDRSKMKADAWRPRFTEDTFDPGSTMKPVAIAGALDYGVVTPNMRFDCEKGYWIYGGKPLRDSHPMEILTVAEIIQHSSNIGTAKIALRMGDRRLYNTLRKFGFGQRTGIPMTPETRGIFRPVEKWGTLSVTRFPIGQGIAVSPLQLVRAYCALANGGSLMRLRLIDRLENPNTGIVLKNPIKPGYQIYRNPNTHRQIIEMMKLVTMSGGTATKAAIPGYPVAGKTGTSQKVVNGRYSQSKFFASFIGFVPANKPEFVLLVTADEPKGNHYGGTVSAPTFRNIAERTLRYLNVQPEFHLDEVALRSSQTSE